MKRVLLLAVLIALAMPVSATWWPTVSPRAIRVAVGETTSVTATAWWSGLTDYGGGINWRFVTPDPDIAKVDTTMTTSGSREVAITGVAPGQTYILYIRNGSLNPSGLADITVYCGDEPAVKPAEALVETKLGDEVTLQAMSSIADRSTFVWYAGELGDTSRAIPFGGTTLTFTPETSGVHHYWVMATTPCSASSTAFEVNVRPLKRRAVR
ncbi:MAG TPA: hypothetical protein VF787_18290 [Thermoanaerobaculia bacterium]